MVRLVVVVMTRAWLVVATSSACPVPAHWGQMGQACTVHQDGLALYLHLSHVGLHLGPPADLAPAPLAGQGLCHAAPPGGHVPAHP